MNPSYYLPISPVLRSSRSPHFRALTRLLVGFLGLAWGASLQAAIVSWQGGASSDWNTAANWNSGLATTSDTNALTSMALGTYTVNYSSVMTSGGVTALTLGQASGVNTVTLNVGASMVLSLAGATGAALTVDRNAIVNVNTGGSITMTKMTGGNCGVVQNGGQLILNGGAVYTPATSSCYLGVSNNGSVLIENGGVLSGANSTAGASIRIGTATSSTNASLTITGADSKILSRVLYVGRSGTGNVFSMQGGYVSLVGGGSPSLSLAVGSSGSWSGVATITSGTLVCGGYTIIGGDTLSTIAPTGAFTASASQSGGLWTQNNNTYVGVVSAANGAASYATTGGTFNGQAVYVGHNGTAALTAGTSSLTIGGGLFTATSLTVGRGGVTLAGGTATFSGTAIIGDGASTSNSVLSVTGGSNSFAGGVIINAYASLTGSGTLGANVTVNGGTVNGRGLSVGATTLNGASTMGGYNIASGVTVNSGTTTLSGTTQSTATLSVTAGATLNANGTIAGSANVSGLLKGNSTVTGSLTLTGGTLNPGNSPGITTVGGDFTMTHTATLVAEVSGATAGLTYDQVKVSGNVSLDGTLDLTTLSGLTLGTPIILIDNINGGTTTGYFSTILTSGSTYTFTEAADSSVLLIGGTSYRLGYGVDADHDGFANDVTLTVVPEPNAWGLVAGGVGILIGFQRLRRREIRAMGNTSRR